MTIFSAIVMLGILIFVHELGHFIFAKIMSVRVLKFSLGFGPKVIGKKIGDTEYLISAVPLGGYVKMLGEEAGEETQEEESAQSFHFQPLWKRATIVIAGPVFNVLLTYLIYVVVLSAQIPVNIPNVSSFLPVVDEVAAGSPAASSGLKAGDRIVSIDGKNIDTWFEMVNMVRENPGREIGIVVLRGRAEFAARVVPNPVEVGEGAEKIVVGQIGVMKKNGDFFETIESDSVGEALYQGAIATGKMGLFVVDSIRMLAVGDVSLRNVGGPVTIVQESGRAAAAGILPYFIFMALFSVNLGILNLLPIPVLDGGHLLLFAVEGLKGSPLNEKAVGIVNRIGLALILALMIVAFYNDFVRLFAGG
ncbi:MAG: RIP metalloprotease RseP [Thermodesulfovibrionales bacterium]